MNSAPDLTRSTQPGVGNGLAMGPLTENTPMRTMLDRFEVSSPLTPAERASSSFELDVEVELEDVPKVTPSTLRVWDSEE